MNENQTEVLSLALSTLVDPENYAGELRAYMRDMAKFPSNHYFKYIPEEIKRDKIVAKDLILDAITRSGYFAP
jgi:hypothetical protein